MGEFGNQTQVVDGLLHHQQVDLLDDAKRILGAPSVFFG